MVLLPFRQEEFVDLIAHHQQTRMPAHQLGQSFQLRTAHHSSGRIPGGVEHQQARAFRDACFQLVEIEPEALLRVRRNHNTPGSRQSGHVRVTEPVRRRDQHFVAGIEQHLEQVEDRLLSTVGDQHLARPGGNAVLAAQLLSHRRSQFGITGRRPVAGDSIAEGLAGGVDDELGGVEIRLSGAQTADVAALVPQRFRPGPDFKGQGRLQGFSPLGQNGRGGHQQRTSPGCV